MYSSALSAVIASIRRTPAETELSDRILKKPICPVAGKPHLTVMISNSIAEDYGLNAGQIVREAAQEIKGGGGGQPFFATAGGAYPEGIEKAIEKAEKLVMHKINVD